MLKTQKLMKVLMLSLFMIAHISSMYKYFYDQHLFFISERKGLQIFEFVDNVFEAEKTHSTRVVEHHLSNQEDEMKKVFDFYYTPKANGFMVLSSGKKKKPEALPDDFVTYISKTNNRKFLGSISITEKVCEHSILNYLRGSEKDYEKQLLKSLSPLGFLKFMNSQDSVPENWNVKISPQIILYKYDLKIGILDLENLYLTTANIAEKIIKNNSGTFLSQSDDAIEFDDLVIDDTGKQQEMIESIIAEMRLIIDLLPSWKASELRKEKLDLIKGELEKVLSSLKNDLVEHLSLFTDKTITNDCNFEFNIAFLDYRSNFLFRQITEGVTFEPIYDLDLSPEKQANLAKHLKFRSVSQVANEWARFAEHKFQNPLNPAKYISEYDFEDQNLNVQENELAMDLVGILNYLIETISSEDWLKAYVWVNQVIGIEEFFTKYTEMTLKAPKFKDLLENNILRRSTVDKIGNIFGEPKSLDDIMAIPILQVVQDDYDEMMLLI